METENKIESLPIKEITSTSEDVLYKYDEEQKILYLDLKRFYDPTNFIPLAVIEDVDYLQILDTAQMVINVFKRYNCLMALDYKTLKEQNSDITNNTCLLNLNDL